MGLKHYQSKYPKGKNNLISDVSNITVGHKSLENHHTGVTVIKFHDDIFHQKYVGASHIINGFGKTTGLVQVNELGTIESHIALTNTLSVGIVQHALVKYMLEKNEDNGVKTGTVNVIVGECNDGYLNEIREQNITEQDVFDAIDNCKEVFEEGGIGAGRGMICFGMKGGIGSASRIIHLDQEYTVGALLLTNFGGMKDFIDYEVEEREEQGSCMIILATDVPLTHRQLERVCRHAVVGLSRCGSYVGNGSGDVVIGVSTGNMIPHYGKEIVNLKCINDNSIDLVNRAVIDAIEESVYSSLEHSPTTTGNHHTVYSIHEVREKAKQK